MDNIQLISVTRGQEKVKVKNPTNYPLVGTGKQGAVFRISHKRCVKIYASLKHLEKERNTYTAAQDSPIIPKLYEIGENYIVIEYIEGPTLEKYLEKKRMITKSLTKQILFVLQEMKRLEFTRLDVRLKHVIVTKKDGLKIIDHVNSFTIKEDRPIKLFNKLKELELLHTFLKQVKQLDRDIYLEWKQTMRSSYFK